MYVATHNDSVILGPIAWNPRLIAAAIRDELDLDTEPTILSSDSTRVPFDVMTGVRIRPCQVVKPSYDEFQQLAGPTWTFTPDLGTATWTVVDKQIDLVKGELKSRLAGERYRQEVTPLKMTLNGSEVTILTERGAREFLTSTYQAMSVGDSVNWKFPERWMSITRAQLLSIIVAIRQHVQSKFDWEMNQETVIDSAPDAPTLRSLRASLFPEE
jgi:hypothetical protein